MAKKAKKSNKSLLNSLLVVLGISLFLFGFVVFKNNQENSDVKGESTEARQVDSSGRVIIPPKNRTANAGEACGRSINRACQRNLICAPLGPSYRLLATKATEVESTTESEGVSAEEKMCIGKTEDEIKTGCLPYIPYYGACVKKGVWPPPPQKPTPTPTSTECTNRWDCKDEPGKTCPMPIKYPEGTIFCTPTPTSTPTSQVSCVWCGLNCVDKSKVQACALIPPPQGYSCVNRNNVCVKVANGGSSVPKPVPSRQPLPNWWPFR